VLVTAVPSAELEMERMRKMMKEQHGAAVVVSEMKGLGA